MGLTVATTKQESCQFLWVIWTQLRYYHLWNPKTMALKISFPFGIVSNMSRFHVQLCIYICIPAGLLHPFLGKF